eukprot:759374-Hanusia_phi.AAC.4
MGTTARGVSRYGAVRPSQSYHMRRATELPWRVRGLADGVLAGVRVVVHLRRPKEMRHLRGFSYQ